MSVYLDYNASVPADRRVLEAMTPFFCELHGNPSSTHSFGQRSRAAVESARARVAELIGAAAVEIVFTSSGTEANNMAIAGALAARPGRLVISEIEHPSVYNLALRLEEEGKPVERAGVNGEGLVRIGELQEALNKGGATIVSVMAANNETGVIQPFADVAGLCREKGVIFHCDASQAIGKIPFRVDEAHIDLATISPHKFGGPIGIGALYIRSGVELPRLMEGGGQEMSRRPGTESAALTAGFGEACCLAGERLPEYGKRLGSFRDRMEKAILDSVGGCAVQGAGADRLPNTSNISFGGVSGELLAIRLDLEGFAVSTGSACHSGKVSASRVLIAMGIGEELAQSSIRISPGLETEWKEIKSFVDTLGSVVRDLRNLSS